MEMTRHLKPSYVRAHLNSKSVSKVLIDNGSTVNVMSLRMLRALGRSINDPIQTKVVVSTFTREVSKTLGILPIDITIGKKKCIIYLFCDRIYCKLQHFVRERVDSCQLVYVILVLSSPVLTFLEG